MKIPLLALFVIFAMVEVLLEREAWMIGTFQVRVHDVVPLFHINAQTQGRRDLEEGIYTAELKIAPSDKVWILFHLPDSKEFGISEVRILNDPELIPDTIEVVNDQDLTGEELVRLGRV